MKIQKKIYFDYAASTPLDPVVLDEILPYYKEYYGNAGGVHQYAQYLSEQVEKQRGLFAEHLKAKTSEIIFTSSATESNNTIIKGVARALQDRGKHILISSIEHPSVYGPAEYLRQQGFDISKIPVDEKGILNLSALEKMTRKDTVLVSVMHVNNETGIIQPIDKIGEICKRSGIQFHTDAAQSLGKVPINLSKLHIDYLSASSHKIYGPAGSALLYCRSGSPYQSLLHGGGQEEGRRSSTINVPAIAGFGAAFNLAVQNQKEEWTYLEKLRQYLITKLIKTIADLKVYGNPPYVAPGIINISFKNADAEILSMQLNRLGFAVSTGSACSSGAMKESPVLKAMGIDRQWSGGSLRFSIGRFTKDDDIEQLCEILPELVEKVRKIR